MAASLAWLIGPIPGILLGGLAGFAAAAYIERRLRSLGAIVAKIARGDRYAIVPKQPRGPLAELANAADTLRTSKGAPEEEHASSSALAIAS